MFPQDRLRGSVWPVQAVQTEVAVVRFVAEVAAVGPTSCAVGQRLDKSVGPPLPDEATLQTVRGLDRVPVLGQRAVAVAHRMRVLAHDQGEDLLTRPGMSNEGRDGRVHRRENVADLLFGEPAPANGALVLDGPRWVVAADVAGGSVVVGAVTGLVAQRPDDH